MIQISALTKSFKRLAVLRSVDLTFPDGSVTAVIGPNGSGKTTLMKCMLGLVRPDAGQIVINGVQAIDNAEARRALGYMSQIAQYPDNLAPVDIFAMIERVRGAGSPNKDQLVERFDLAPHLRKPMRTLSGGTRQKVGAIIALMFEPRVLLLDEPTAGLDPISTSVLKELIRDTRDRGASVLITSHILSEIQELADRVVFLHEGTKLFEGGMELLLEQTGDTSLERSIAALMRNAQQRGSTS